jgi:DNA-binding Lrp family transcriptional regulator
MQIAGYGDLDEVDLRLIELLRSDSRMSHRAMSAEVGLREAAVAARIYALIERQLLTVGAVIDWERAGYAWDFWVQIEVGARPVEEVAAELAKIDVVISVQMVFGGSDLILHVLAVDRTAVATFLSEHLIGIAGIRAAHSSVTLETFKFEVQSANLPSDFGVIQFPRPAIEMDTFDEEILMAFMQDGRRSRRQVARELAVSDSTIRVRLRRMEDAGLVQMRTQVDPARTRLLRYGAYLRIGVAGRSGREICVELAAMPEVVLVSHLAGNDDALALIATSSQRNLREFAGVRIRKIDGIQRVQIDEIVSNVKFDFRWARLLPAAA